MPFEPFESVRIAKTGVEITRFGFGCAPIGGLFREVDDDEATRTIERAWTLGIRFFDVAPLYGYGTAERRLGGVLQGRPRAEFVVSTKVGRLVRPTDRIPPGADIDRQALAGLEDAFYAGTHGRRMVFDYSADGVTRSLEESLERLGLQRVDIAFIHDPDDHWQAAIEGAYPALHRLREQGVVGAIGVGMNQSAMLARFAHEAEIDLFLLAGRYTLLDQDALRTLLPLCVERGIRVVVGGVMNSGVLADPRPGAHFDYAPADADVVDRARTLATTCERHGVPLRAAAVQFPLAHPAVAGLLAGVRKVEHLEEYPGLFRREIPVSLWQDLKEEGVLAADAPTPE